MNRGNRGPGFPSYPTGADYAPPPFPLNRVPNGRPPGAPTEAPAPMLPQLPFVPYDPPIPDPQLAQQQSPITGLAVDYEAKTITIGVPALAGPAPIPLYITTRRWLACDVYVSLDTAMPPASLFYVFVNAVSQSGTKTLVATGRYGVSFGGATAQLPVPSWVCAARAAAERYEVDVILYDGGTFAALSPAAQLTVTVVCTDAMTDARDDGTGVKGFVTNFISSGYSNTAPIACQSGVTNVKVLPFPTLTQLTATNATGFPLWLWMWDYASVSGGTTVGAGVASVWGVGANPGDSLLVDTPYASSNGNLAFAFSLSPFTYAAPGSATVGAGYFTWR